MKSAVASDGFALGEIILLKDASVKIASFLKMALEKIVCPVKFASLKSAFSSKCVDVKLVGLLKIASWKIVEPLNVDFLKLTPLLNSAQ